MNAERVELPAAGGRAFGRVLARIGRVSCAYPVRMGAYPCVSAVNSVRIRVTDLSPIGVLRYSDRVRPSASRGL